MQNKNIYIAWAPWDNRPQKLNTVLYVHRGDTAPHLIARHFTSISPATMNELEVKSSPK